MKLAGLFSFLAVSLSHLTGTVVGAEKPNVIYILADDLGIGDLSCYGQKKFTTPNIDRLANEGLQFTNHYSGNTVCSPSRAVLMSGVHSGRCYIRGNSNPARAALPEEWVTVPELFQSAGYRTGAFGKWGLGITNNPGPQNPATHGFDEFCGWKSQLIAHTYYPSSYVRNGKEIPLDGETYLHPIIMEAARDFITDSVKSQQPFFCYIPTAIPHAAMHAPQELHQKWRKVFPKFDKKIGKYKAGPDEHTPDVINPIAGFAAMMEHLDNEVGLLLELVKKLGIDDNTLIMFASDNGAHKEGGHNPKFWNSSGGLRGHKRDIHEGGIKSPFLARWPGKIAAKSTTDHLSGFHDLLPTTAALLAIDTPEQNTGISYLPTLLAQQDQEQHEYLYIGFETKKFNSQALRFDEWKVFQKNQDQMELYNLTNDPSESKNLADDPAYQEVITRATRYIKEATQSE